MPADEEPAGKEEITKCREKVKFMSNIFLSLS